MRAAEWSGGVGETWAREWQRTDRSFAGLESTLEQAILAAAPAIWSANRPLRCIDLGCGAGTTSLAIAEALPHAEVTGLDLSPDLVAVAVNRAEGLAGIRERCRFVVGDAAERVAALAPVDLFFSRHGVMFFENPISAFSGLAAAAAPGSKLVFSCFASLPDNPWATETLTAVTGQVPASATFMADPAIIEPGPFAFANPVRVGAILAAAGWHHQPPERIAFRYVAGGGEDPVGEALFFFRRIGPAAAALRQTSEAARPASLERLAKICRRRCDGGEVAFPAAAWLWSATLQEPVR